MARYNTRVPRPENRPADSQNQIDQKQNDRNKNDPQNTDLKEEGSRPHRHALYATETVGLLLIAALVLAITLIRYWRYIHWSLR